MKSITFFVLGIFLLSLGFVSSATYYVSTSGSDSTGDGSAGSPWASISHAAATIPIAGGDTILVMDGVYNMSSYVTRLFDSWVTIQAEHPYRVKLKNIQNGVGNPALQITGIAGSAKIVIKDFVISNDDPSFTCSSRSQFLVLIQNVSDVLFENNIVFKNSAQGSCNEILKINRAGGGFPKNITVRGNVFYDPASVDGSDIIDAVLIGEATITENIFFSRGSPNSQSFVTIKREIPLGYDSYTPAVIKVPRFIVSKNIFLHWDGGGDQAFVQFGEDALAQDMITNSLIENNLFIGDSVETFSAPIQLKGVKNITVRANTFTGNMPGGAYGFRIGLEPSNLDVENISIRNNIFSDPTGTMGTSLANGFDNSANGNLIVSSFVLDNNLYWNNSGALPQQGIFNVSSDDVHLVNADPLLETDQSGIVLPVWDEGSQQFLSGSTTIRGEFVRLVNAYGTLGSGSSAIDAADPLFMPSDDILGNTRDANPDLGAVEYLGGSSSGGGVLDVNADGNVNIIDLALATFWQGKTNAGGDWNNYAHLDVNADGSVNWLDIVEIVLGI